jgi:hypothetical protein
MCILSIPSVAERGSIWNSKLMKQQEELWIKAFTPWGTPCSVVLKNGKIIKVHSSMSSIKEEDYRFINLDKTIALL